MEFSSFFIWRESDCEEVGMNLQFTTRISSLVYIFTKGLICPSREKENPDATRLDIGTVTRQEAW